MLNRRFALVSALALLACSTAACGSGDSGTAAAAPAATASSMPSMTTTSTAAMSGPVGPGCAGYAAGVPSGAGSVDGMAQDPVATAASNNPLLKTLVAAVSGQLNPKVNLVDTLNGGQFTVFAPVDSAFAKIPAATINSLKTDDATLSKILTYHVVAGQLDPMQVIGSQKTVQGGDLEVTGTPDALKVNGINVICGGVKTANATVYLIDGVLMPKM
jgi:uncharacterized surface protein with fasciclin (FAS1) repeats